MVMAGCVGGGQAPPARAPGTQLAGLLDREWDWRLREFPLFATSVGDHRYDDRLPVETPENYERRADATNAFLAELARIDRSALSTAGRIDYDVFKITLEERPA